MQDCDNISPYLLGSGITELDRVLKMLQPESVSIMHLGVEEWIEFTHAFAKNINYYAEDIDSPAGHWQEFYQKAVDLKDSIADYDEGEVPAHLALLIAFLNLLEYPKASLNGLTKRHLDFYYRDVLQIKNRAFESDKVFTVFELNKTTEEYLIEAGTLLNGGKDSDGNIQHYAVEENTVINKCGITDYRTIYADNSGVYQHQTDSVTELNGRYPFGIPGDNAAEYGFSIASNTLFLKEGSRKVKIKVSCKNGVKPEWRQALKIYFSTNEGWTEKEPIGLTKDEFFVEMPASNELIWGFEFGDDDQELIAPTIDLHNRGGGAPVVKFIFNGIDGRKAHSIWSQNSLKEITIDTETVYDKDLKVKTDQGFVDTGNEFFPFGAVPKKGSALKVHADELIGKRVTSAEVEIAWKDLPDDFRDIYKGYYKEYYDNNFVPNLITSQESIVKNADGSDRFKVKTNDTTVALFGNATKRFTNFSLGKLYAPEDAKDYPISMSLEEDFAHQEYGVISSLAAIIKNEVDRTYVPSTDPPLKVPHIPQLPYTPLVEGISLKARTSATLNATSAEIKVSWETPFGYQNFDGLQKQFLPQFASDTGELFLGIENEKSNQLFQFLIQLEEGTENPDRIKPEDLKNIKWSYLSGDEWKELSSLEILKNETDNFLKTGLFQFKIPSFDNKNTLLPSGRLWLRARLDNYYDVISRALGFHSQAVRAVFENKNNTLSHLPTGIEPETISKLINRKAQVKKVIQPYASFDGKAEEDDEHYYTRVSERLRHKNRAVSSWDCNHVLLEEFSYIHKVKTINHSLKNDYIQPGEVLIVAVPSMQNQKVYNLLQPKISQAKLNELADYINQRNSLHVEAKVMSPIYMPVKIVADVKYHEGYDASFYEKELQQDMMAYLAPWTTQGENAIQFGGNIFYSQVVYFIEQLEYVDFLKNLRIVINGTAQKNVLPQDPMTIVTSVPAEQHVFNTIKQSVCQV